MAEEVPETVDGAIRGWIVAVAFTLVLVGGELMAEKDGIRFWTGIGLAIAGLPCYLSAGWWKTLKPQLNERFLLTLNDVATDARWWVGCLFVILLGLIFSQNFERWLLPSAFRPQAPLSATAPAPTVPSQEIPAVPEKSPLLGLDDAARWQMLTKFYDNLSANGDFKCASRIQIDKGSQAALEIWKELQPILRYTGWNIRASSDQNQMFRKGITISAGVDSGAPLVCAIRLEQLINTSSRNIPVRIMQNQISQDLRECNNECIEIIFGDFN